MWTPLLNFEPNEPYIAKVDWVVSILIIMLAGMELLYNLCHCWGWVLIAKMAASHEKSIDLFNSSAMCGSVIMQTKLFNDFSIAQV